jgi:transcriptional regulator
MGWGWGNEGKARKGNRIFSISQLVFKVDASKYGVKIPYNLKSQISLKSSRFLHRNDVKNAAY